MKSREFKQWKVYNRLNPIGPRRTDLGFAILAAQILNARRTKASDPLADPKDFLPTFYTSPIVERRKMEQQVAQFMVGFGASATPDGPRRGASTLRKR